MGEHAKLERLIDGMAEFMGSVLTLKDPDNSPDHDLSNVLKDEFNYVPDAERLKRLQKLKARHDFANAAASMAESMLTVAVHQLDQDSPNVLLAPYAKLTTFYNQTEHVRRGRAYGGRPGRVLRRTRVGGIAGDLQHALTPIVESWLHACDGLMTLHFEQDAGSDDTLLHAVLAASEHDVYILIEALALSISKRITLTEPRNAASQAAEELSARMLAARANMEVARSASAAEHRVRSDLLALRALHSLCNALSNHDVPVLKTLMIEQLSHLRHLFSRPPSGLGFSGRNAQCMNFQYLRRIAEPDMEFEVQKAVLFHWYQRWGATTHTAVILAISKLEGWTPPKEGFQAVLDTKFYRGSRPDPSIVLPTMPFVKPLRQWHLAPPDSSDADALRRAVPTVIQRRIIRLTSMIWQLFADGEFERGVIDASIVHDVAARALESARYVAQCQLDMTNVYNIGITLRAFQDNLVDMQGALSDDVRSSICSLSHFSLAEIMYTFHHGSEILPLVARRFTQRTWEQCVRKPPEGYYHFALDGLHAALPIINRVRQLLWRDPSHIPNPLGDLLRSVPRIRAWNPRRDGVLQLSAKDLTGKKSLVEWLRRLSSQKDTAVRYCRPMLSNGKQSSVHMFVFDSRELVTLIRT